MDNFKTFKTTIGGKEITVETGKYAFQTNGSCIVKSGDTSVMVNVTMNKQPRPGQDFFPLSVDYLEKMYAVGKIPGGFKKREARPSDKAILTSRLIDRPLRPLFPKGFYNDVSVVVMPLSIDPDVAPEPLAMLGSSFALAISDIPFAGPTGSVHVSLVDDKFILNATAEERSNSLLDLTVAGTHDAVLMVEAGAKFVSEDTMLKAIMFAHEAIKELVEFQNKAAKEIGKAKADIALEVTPEEIATAVKEYATDKMVEVMKNFDRHERDAAEEAMNADVLEHFAEEFEGQQKFILDTLYKMKKAIMREKILNEGVRPDGRKLEQIRPIWCEAGVLPRVHGSGVFTRGETQAMTIATLGSLSEVQKLEGLDDEDQKRYMHHYNFPGYSVGEAKPMRSPGRREIGHGALAERSLEPVLPSEEEFPYAIRTVSEVLSSNGSTSQASVCGSTLSLMDAGVPIKAPVAGIAMGLIKDADSKKVAVLTDIQGLEDFLGDMDFKVAGTEYGITAIQMDIKIKGIDEDILRTALERARLGRLEILGKMTAVIDKPRASLSKYAPKIITFNINPDKIKDVIGSGGKTINKIIDETGVKIDIEDDGRVCVAAVEQDKLDRAKELILDIVTELEVGKIYTGKVARIIPIGAFVEMGFNKDGMIHISKLSSSRVEKVEDVVNVGDVVEVQVLKIDDRGRVDLKLIAIAK